MTQHIIGICGRKGSGKDTIGDMICKIDPTFEKIAFADVVKDIVASLFGWDREMLQGNTVEGRKWREEIDEFWAKELDMPDFSPRKAMQLIGTDIMRNNLHKNIWIISVKRKIMNKPDKNFVITDVRFPNEILAIKNLNGKIIRVERGERPDWWNIASNYNKFGKEGVTEKEIEELNKIHPSERDWIDIDEPNVIFHNDSTIEDLESKVTEWMDWQKL